MIKIAEMNVGATGTTSLVVTAVSARKTKRGSDYLSLEFFDGVDKISANYWDWAGKNMPAINAILDVDYRVTEYAGAKQLTVNAMRSNTTLSLAEFMPKSNIDLELAYKDAYAIASDIHDDTLRGICLDVLDNFRDLWLHIPGAKTVHHAYMGGTLVHSLSVARIAKAIAEQVPCANVDLATAGALLHDVGKLFTYSINGVTVDMTCHGRMFDHLYMGARIIEQAAQAYPKSEVVDWLTHIILSHHGSQAHGAIVPPVLIEAHIVYHADSVDAAIQMVVEAARKPGYGIWTDRIWALENMPHIKPNHVTEVLDQ
jgi:3'-5' exoribonuclease